MADSVSQGIPAARRLREFFRNLPVDVPPSPSHNDGTSNNGHEANRRGNAMRLSGNRKLLARLLALSQVGFVIAGGPILGLLLDRWLGTTPWLLIVGAVLGFASGMVQLVTLSRPRPGEGGPDEDRRE